MAVSQTTYEICVDCAMYHANGLKAVENPDHRWQSHKASENIFVVGDYVGFSMNRCDSCHSTAGGDRHAGYINYFGS